VFAAVLIVTGLGWSTFLYMRRRMAEQHHEAYKIRIGRSLLLGLEVVVAADIVKTIAVAPTLKSLGVLAGLVLIRTFLSWTRLKAAGRGNGPPTEPHRPRSLQTNSWTLKPFCLVGCRSHAHRLPLSRTAST
jgi:uncharacterized membrane protein